MVLSFVLVGEGGRTYRIEPANGVTDPVGWREPGIDELIQDDDVFHSAVCSFGCMGIVYSALIQVRDFYWMNEWSFITTWDTVKSTFRDSASLIDFVGAWDDVSLLVAPTKAEHGEKDGISLKGEYPVSITLRSETNERRVIGANYMDDIAKAFEDLHIITGKAPAEGRWWLTELHQPQARRRVDGAFSRPQHRQTWMVRRDDRPRRDAADQAARQVLRDLPQGRQALGRLWSRTRLPHRAHHRDHGSSDRARARPTTTIVSTTPPRSQSGLCSAATAYASPQYGRTTAMFEVLMAKGTEGGAEALALIEEAMLRDPDVRVHWGLHMDRLSSRNTDFRAKYPRWGAFEATFRRFNAKGTFHNAFTDRIGLS